MTENRPKFDPQALLSAFGDANGVANVLGAVPEALGTSMGCLGDAFGRLLAALGSPRVAQDRLWGAIGACKSCPERVWTRPRSGPGRSKRPKLDFSSIRGRSDWIFIDFRPIFHRFSSEPRASKTRKQNLKKKSRDPQRTSWLLRCAVASCCSHIFRNDFRTLRVQPFSLRTHKLT